ncbi:MAG: PEP-CTERM sorting domain-containing protein [Phycisphaerae bacterium]|nr:PEP-CTERM sorting domain-containing protein [Phycisphaerae bacterium]
MKKETLLALCVIGILGVSLTSADSIRDLTWAVVDTGTTGTIMSLSGDSLSNLYYADSGTSSIKKYNASTSTWSQVSSWNDHVGTSDHYDASSSVSVMAVSGNHLYVADDGDTGWYSYYNGTSWSDAWFGPTDNTYSITANGDYMVAGSSGDYITRASAGAYVGREDLGSGTIVSVDFADGDTRVYWAYNSSNHVYKSTDSGATWTETTSLPLGGVPNSYAVCAIDADRAVIASGKNGRVYRTSDGGTTWEQAGGTFDTDGVRGIYVNGWDDIIAYGSFNDLYHWNGTNWAAMTLPDNESPMRSMVCVDDTYFVAGDDGKMYMSIPEPTTLALLGFGVILLKRKR